MTDRSVESYCACIYQGCQNLAFSGRQPATFAKYRQQGTAFESKPDNSCQKIARVKRVRQTVGDGPDSDKKDHFHGLTEDRT